MKIIRTDLCFCSTPARESGLDEPSRFPIEKGISAQVAPPPAGMKAVAVAPRFLKRLSIIYIDCETNVTPSWSDHRLTMMIHGMEPQGTDCSVGEHGLVGDAWRLCWPHQDRCFRKKTSGGAPGLRNHTRDDRNSLQVRPAHHHRLSESQKIGE